MLSSQKNRLGITGIIMLPEERKALESLIDVNETEVFQMETRSAEINHAINIVFQDFSPVAFLRDAVLGAALSAAFGAAYGKIKAVIQRYTTKRESVKNVSIEKDVTTEGGVHYTIYVVADAERFEHLLQQLSTLPQEQLQPRSENDTIVIKLNEDGQVETKII